MNECGVEKNDDEIVDEVITEDEQIVGDGVLI